jgi:hypothetical protein
MKILASEFEQYRGFLSYFFDKVMIVEAVLSSKDNHPIAVLDRMVIESPAQARRGLAMAINDCLEMSARFSPAQVKAIDADLAQATLPTLSALRTRFWRRIRSAMDRGRIRGEVEYFAVKNAAEMAESGNERDQLWALVEEFEERVRANSH